MSDEQLREIELDCVRPYVRDEDEVEWRAAVLRYLVKINESLIRIASSGEYVAAQQGEWIPDDLGPDPRPPSRWRRLVDRVKTRIIEWWRPSVAFGPAGSRLRPVAEVEDLGAERRFFGAGGSGAGITHEEAEE